MIPNILNSSREKKLSKRSRERRWTTGLEKGQLSLSFNHDPLVADDNSIRLSQVRGKRGGKVQQVKRDKKLINIKVIILYKQDRNARGCCCF